MGVMSDLHLLAGRVLDGETIPEVADDSSYKEGEIASAVAARLIAEE